jgi:hypothetical protein
VAITQLQRRRLTTVRPINVSTVNRWRANELLQSDPQRGILRFDQFYIGTRVLAFRRNIILLSSVNRNNILMHMELSVCLHQAGTMSSKILNIYCMSSENADKPMVAQKYRLHHLQRSGNSSKRKCAAAQLRIQYHSSNG